VKAAYGFIAPSVKFDENGNMTTTTDYCGHRLTLAAARNFGAMNLWQTTFSTNWEFHQTNVMKTSRLMGYRTLV